MKLIAIAALLGSTQAAAITGCTVAKGEAFTDKECKTAADPAAVTDADLKKLNDNLKLDDACVAVTGSTTSWKKDFCDGTGVGQIYYTDKDCKTEAAAADQKGKTEWGKCVLNALDAKTYVKWTDAAYMKAGAAAVMAMIASQY